MTSHETLRRLRTIAVGLGLLSTATACDRGADADEPQSECQGIKCDSTDDTAEGEAAAPVCIGIRGNGPLIWAHFGSLARVLEDVGPLSTVLGGSSGSVSAFMTESILANEAFRCHSGEMSCSPEDALIERRQMALLFKTVPAYAEYLADTPEAVVLGDSSAIVRAIADSGLPDFADGELTPERLADAAAAVVRLRDAMRAGKVANLAGITSDLLDDEVVALVTAVPDPTDAEAVQRQANLVRDIAASARNFGQFSAESPDILVRPGFISFVAVAERLGIIANFYAGYGFDATQKAEFERFVVDCGGEESVGKLWPEIRDLAINEGATCGQRFERLIDLHWSSHQAGADPQRIDEPVGAHADVVVTTSVFQGDTRRIWESAREHYLQTGNHDYPWSPEGFDDTGFGYFGPSALTSRIEGNPLGFGDLKTAKAVSLGEVTWAEALAFSPAEPGLARALEIDDTFVSAGGWSDLFPMQALRNAGCEKIVYLTTIAAEHPFQTGLAQMLGMSEDEGERLYDLSNEDSAIFESLELADGVWCTNWNGFGATQIEGLMEDGYTAPLQTTKPDAFASYDNVVTPEALDKAGCTPGSLQE